MQNDEREVDWIKRAKVGDKVRYLDGEHEHSPLTEDKTYEIIRLTFDGGVIIESESGGWYIDDCDLYNAHCFELVESEDESSVRDTLDLLASLSAEVANNKRQLVDLKAEVKAYREESAKLAYTVEARHVEKETPRIARKTVIEYE